MKNLKYFAILCALTLIGASTLGSCQEDDATIGNIIAPNNLIVTAEIVGQDAGNPNGDGSGLVMFTATADNAISYSFQFGDGLSEVAPSGEALHRFSVVGVNTFTVVVNATGTGGLSTGTTIDVEVFSSFDDLEAKNFLSGGVGSSKVWYLDAAEVGHLGVGPTLLSGDPAAPEAYWYPSYFATQPFEKCGEPISDCLCDDELTFSLNTDNQLTFQLNNNGQTFFNASHQDIVGGTVGEDACFDFDTSGTSIVSLAPSDALADLPDPDFETRGTIMHLSNDAFMGYYVSSSSYEIISVTNSTLYVRVLDGLSQDLAWYHKFTTTPPNTGFETQYTDLIWSDEFNVNGAPDAANWGYDLGAGGWGNGELQTYTSNAENVIVEDGSLKIIAKANGSGYTSARLKSEGLFDFTYGRVEFSAKLPEGGGTWPALWSLGANFDTVGWPACGEMDIMEHVGNNQNTVHGTVHLPGNSGGAGIGATTTVSTASSEFHTYTLEWSAESVQVLVDGMLYFTYPNTASTPFNSDFFLIMNVAMGGTFGGNVDPNFVESTMEVDYVRVYQ